MPDLWMDVDTALAEVPVNLFPLIDDTDFKSREVAIAYNQAGMDLVWNFITPAGAYTQTAVTPTTSGNYDWVHVGDGMYTIEMPASGGASINNDTEGFGWFTGICTGVLAWRGPTIGFRAAGLNDALIEAVWSATRGLAGTALPAAAADAAGGLPISDAGGLDLDARIDAAITSRMATYTQPTGFLAATFPSDPADQSLIIAATDAIIADTNDIQARLPAALVSGRMSSDVVALSGSTAAADLLELFSLALSAAGQIDNGTLDTTLDTYQGHTEMLDDEASTDDHYGHWWAKNGQPIASGITSPTIQVINAFTGADLVAQTAMSEVDSLGYYYYTEPTNRIVDGVLYLCLCKATIGGALQVWPSWIFRDSAA